MRSRPAELGDGSVIAEIYNQGIEDRLATFETELRTPSASLCGCCRVLRLCRARGL